MQHHFLREIRHYRRAGLIQIGLTDDDQIGIACMQAQAGAGFVIDDMGFNRIHAQRAHLRFKLGQRLVRAFAQEIQMQRQIRIAILESGVLINEARNAGHRDADQVRILTQCHAGGNCHPFLATGRLIDMHQNGLVSHAALLGWLFSPHYSGSHLRRHTANA